MNNVIIGGAGFIGSNLAKYIVNNTRQNVIIIDNLSSGFYKNIKHMKKNPRFKFCLYDIRNDLNNLFSKINPHVIYHMAGSVSVPRSFKNPSEYFSNNVIGTLNVLEAAKKYDCKVIFSSSSSVYGNSNNGLKKKETDVLSPISPYAITKKHCEELCSFYNKEYGLQTACLRYFNVYGPGQNASSEYSGVISKFGFNKTNNKESFIYGDGEQTRDFTFVNDIVIMNRLTSYKKLSGTILNAAYGEPVSINDLVSSIGLEKVSYKEKRNGDIMNSHADISKMKNFLNYTPKFNIDKGLKVYLSYLKQKKNEFVMV